MKKGIIVFSLLLISLLTKAVDLQPYYNIGKTNKSVTTLNNEIITALKNAGFILSGKYNVANDSNNLVLAFTNLELQKICTEKEKSALIASNLKIGFRKINQEINLSCLNPDYTFAGVFNENYNTLKPKLDVISKNFIDAIKTLGYTLTPFGGKESLDNLIEYQYMWGMPYFKDLVEIGEFTSYSDAVNTITKNITKLSSNYKLVFKTQQNEKEVAVIGIGLFEKEKGESHFLSIIGIEHLCAMPYEILIINKKAYILHGRFRFAFYWPELTMGTFTKIMSTPSDVETALKALCTK